jgi:hypothetical protein
MRQTALEKTSKCEARNLNRETARLVYRPERAEQTSPGQRPGNREFKHRPGPERAQQESGRATVPPFQGLCSGLLPTQAVGLGWFVPAFQAEKPRKTANRWLLGPMLAAFLCVPPAVTAADDKTTLQDITSWSNVFGGQDAEFQYRLNSPQALNGRAAWRLANDGRTLARGEIKVTAAAGQAVTIKVPLTVPPVKEGVVFKVRLSVSVFEGNRDTPAASHDKAIWIFPRDPFFGRSEWLKGLKIAVFDPDRKTTKVLEQLKVPFEELGNVESIQERKDGVVIVGEGISFRDYRGLPEALTRAAARGVAVLCLAPSGGMMLLPGTESARLPVPQALSVRRADVIRQLDKRLDSRAWPGGKMIASTLVLRAEDALVQGEVAGGGWPWLEAVYAEPRGRLAICGFGIVSQWDATPTPRFLLARVLEHLTEKPEPAE